MTTINATQSHRQQTFVMIKPDGVQRNLVGEVISRFERVGLKLVALKMIVPDKERLSTHYSKDDVWYESKGQKTVDNMVKRGVVPSKPAIEYGKDIIRGLLDYMSSGPAILMIWEGNKAMEVVKKLVGGTEPTTSDIGTIRGDYTLDSYDKANEDARAVRNLMHCTDPADGEEEAAREIKIWFTQSEIVNYRHIQEVVLYDPTISGILL
jgi:nucleoside-diphosphate kinase